MTGGSANQGERDAARRLYVGQLNTPPVETVLTAFEGIFERQFYTNHGPLVAEFEERLAEYLGVRHAICTTNGTVALMVAARSIGLQGDVVVPAFTFPATAQALSFAGLRPVFCDVDPQQHTITVDAVRAAMTGDTSALLGVHLWGRACDIDGLQALANETNATLMFDAAHAFGGSYRGQKIGGFGALEVFSFHATKILNCTEGGCITTNDDAIAAAVRTAANFHDQHTFADVPLRINAKMSEAQAAMGLLSLGDLEENIAANRARYERYRSLLADIPGVSFSDHAVPGASNYQYVVCRVDRAQFGLDRDHLVAALLDEGVVAKRYFYPGLHRVEPYSGTPWELPITDALCASLIQLPTGHAVTEADVDRVCGAIRALATN